MCDFEVYTVLSVRHILTLTLLKINQAQPAVGDYIRREILKKKNKKKTRLHKSRSSRDELEFDLSNFV